MMPEIALQPDTRVTNPACTLEWGIDPPSRRRRVGQMVMTWLPLGVYLAVVGCFIVDAKISDEGAIAAPFVAAAVATTVYLFRLALMRTPRVLRRDVRIDILMAGLSGRQLLFGTAMPVLHGMAFVLGVHYLLVFRAFFSMPGARGLDERIMILFFCSTPIAALLLGASMAPPLWVLTKHNMLRVVWIASMVFGWLVQYWIVFAIVFGLLVPRAGFQPDSFLINLVLSMIFPGWIVFRLWFRALRKLETIE